MIEKDTDSVGFVETRTMRVVEAGEPLPLECGKTLGPIDVAYETYGQLNEAGDNAILICHALSGNAHVAGYNHAEDKKPGWWEGMVGPGKGIDTNKYFVVCSNFLGGCSGTTGPCSINPETGRPYGLDFPIITIADMVRVQKLLLDKLGVNHLLAVIGGSIGGMQVLQWSIAYPQMMDAAIPIATTTHLGAQSIAFDAVGRNAILSDANFANGQYHNGQVPANGLAIARMIGHITYLSEQGMRQKFGRELRGADKYSYDLNSEFAVETYLDHQGQAFVERFDANSYLYITKASDYFDLARDYGSLEEAFANVQARFLVVSFSSDWLFTPGQSEAMVDALVANGKNVSFCNIASTYGHDAFLLENDTLGAFLSGFLRASHRPDLRTSWRGHRDPKRDESRLGTRPALASQGHPIQQPQGKLGLALPPNDAPVASKAQGLGNLQRDSSHLGNREAPATEEQGQDALATKPYRDRQKRRFSRFELAQRARVDYELIGALIEPGSRVLDVGCGEGDLLAQLALDRKIEGKGIELDQDLVVGCVGRGIAIIQRDIERGLGSYVDKSFDYVILSQTVQTIKDPERVFRELLRVGRKVVVSFPNFAHWRCRLQLLLTGRAPVTRQLPFRWHNTPNIHSLSLKDFEEFCGKLGVTIEDRIPLVKTSPSPVRFGPNLFAEQVIYVTSKASRDV